MKFLNYELEKTDIDAMITSLSVMLKSFDLFALDEFSPEEKTYCLAYGASALKRLVNHESKILNNELSAIHVSLQIADMINCNELIADNESTQLCSDCSAAISRLLPIFDNYFG
jgi:hypothetical protein